MCLIIDYSQNADLNLEEKKYFNLLPKLHIECIHK